jgi:hypothetical protein
MYFQTVSAKLDWMASTTTPTIKKAEATTKIHAITELDENIVEYRVFVGNPISIIAFLLLRANTEGHVV